MGLVATPEYESAKRMNVPSPSGKGNSRRRFATFTIMIFKTYEAKLILLCQIHNYRVTECTEI